MKRNRLFFTLIVGSVAAAIAACGGVDSSLVGGGASDGGNDVDGTSLAHFDAGVRDGSSPHGDSGASGDSGGGGGDAGAGGSDAGHPRPIIQCGTNGTTVGSGTPVTCSASSPVCCASQYPFDTTPQSFSCTTTDSTCIALDAGSIAIGCRDNSDCPGSTQCCGHEIETNPVNNTFVYESVRCAASCPLSLIDGGASDFRLFCDPSGPNVCTRPGESCVASTLLPGFNVCGIP